MGLFRRRVIPDNMRTATAWLASPDRFAVQAASLGVMTNTLSPGAAGIHGSGTPRGFTGDPGFGYNRWAGRTTYSYQHWQGAAVPVADPKSKRLGIGAGVAGQPGMPSTGTAGTGTPFYAPTGKPGMG